MTRAADRDPAQRLFALLARHLQAYLDGDVFALDHLADTIDEAGLGADELELAVFALRALAGAGPAAAETIDAAPASGSHRVPSPEERDSLSPEAWGCLIDLRRRGTLDPAQFERVIDRLATLGVRPVGPALALEVAANVALRGTDDLPLMAHGDGEITH
jgi:uncharacterized protein Smg (DUF494 family)